VSTYDEHTERYRLEELEIGERVVAFMAELKDEEIVKAAKEALEGEESDYILEEYDLISKIIDYYDKNGRISDKQRYCLCRAIAEIDFFYNEHFDIGYFRIQHLSEED